LVDIYPTPFWQRLPQVLRQELRGYPESSWPYVNIKARSASEECAPTSGESRFLADHASVVPASGFDTPNTVEAFRIASESLLGVGAVSCSNSQLLAARSSAAAIVPLIVRVRIAWLTP
jgi:hypothetical protein